MDKATAGQATGTGARIPEALREAARRQLLALQSEEALAQRAGRVGQCEAEERALRGARREARKRWGHKPYGTVQTHVAADRAREGALLRLYQSGAISLDQLGAAQEIAAEAERIAGDVRVRTVSLETRVDCAARPGGAFFEALGRVRREVAYGRWRAGLPRGVAALVLDIVTADMALTVAARLHHMHARRAKRALCDALDAWAGTIRMVAREIDEADVLAAQAGIL